MHLQKKKKKKKTHPDEMRWGSVPSGLGTLRKISTTSVKDRGHN